MTRDDLIERLAAIEHERWADWQKYMHEERGVGIEAPDAENDVVTWLAFHPDIYGQWERQIATPYDDLTEREKQSDRDQVMRYWPLFVAFVAEWLTQKRAIAIEGFADDGAPLWLDVIWLEEMAGPGEGE